jgi:hypothetical protein
MRQRLIVVREAGNTAKVISAKVREIGAGKLGSCSFYVDPLTGQFTPQYGSDSDVQSRKDARTDRSRGRGMNARRIDHRT